MRRALVALAAAIGCSSPTDATPADDPSAIAMYLEGVPITRAALVGMVPPTTLHFSATLKDPAGRTIGSVKPTVTSRNPSAITIDSAGLMRIAGRGSSWLVAGYNSSTRGLIADSVIVNVVCTPAPFPGICPGA